MQEKKNVRLLISLIVLTLGTALFFAAGFERKSEIDKSIFKIPDQTKIDHVVFESPKGKIELKFDGGKWLVNNLEADKQLVKVFFATILQAEPKRKISTAQQDSLIKQPGANKIKVGFFEGQQVQKEFWVSGNGAKTETYFQLNDQESYLVTIPGYRVYVASIFELPPNDWREKRIFNFNWRNFKSLNAGFQSDSKQNFTISFSDKFFDIEGIDADTTKLNDYLDAVSLIGSERILTPEESKPYDSLFATAPSFQIEVQDIAKRSIILKVFRSNRKREAVPAKVNDEAILLSPQAVNAIDRKRGFFVRK